MHKASMTNASIIGLGTDIVSVQRIANIVEKHGDSFLERWFTDAEIAYCRAKAFPSRHFAGRMAAKEAMVKALRLTPSVGLRWREIEVIKSLAGVPELMYYGVIATIAQAAGVHKVWLSISHCDEYATATVICSG